jgi:hypothetical protein
LFVGLKLVFVAAIVLALATPAAPSAPAFAHVSSKPSLGVPTHLIGIERRADAQTNRVDDERRLSPGLVIGLICAIAASSVALGVAFGLRRRIDRIAGTDPDRDDD